MHADINRWVGRNPGGLDRLNTFWLPEEYDNGFPVIKMEKIRIPEVLVPFRKQPEDNQAVHFFLDDYRFECVWNRPQVYAERYAGKTILSPDFSYDDSYPLPAQIWQAYRTQWIGAYMQSRGIRVIPTTGWGHQDTYDFCFSGIDTGSIVAISTRGCSKSKDIFSSGFDVMVELIEPSVIICAGDFNKVYIGENSSENVISYILERPSYCYRMM